MTLTIEALGQKVEFGQCDKCGANPRPLTRWEIATGSMDRGTQRLCGDCDRSTYPGDIQLGDKDIVGGVYVCRA